MMGPETQGKETQGSSNTVGQPRLSGPQEQAIGLLLSGMTQRAVADEVGVREETISRWLNSDPVFIAGYNSRRRELWETNLARLRRLSDKAVDALATLLDSPDGNLRLRAVQTVLRCGGLEQPGPSVANDLTPEDVEVALALQERARTVSRLLAQ